MAQNMLIVWKNCGFKLWEKSHIRSS